MKQIFTALILVLLVVLQSAGQTFCCLRTKKVGVGVGRGEATVYLVDTKAAEALSEADEREAAKVNNRGRIANNRGRIAVEYVLTLTDRRKNERK